MKYGKCDFLTMYMFYAKITIKSWFQYRVDAFMRSIAVFMREATAIIVIYITLMTFKQVNGWNTNELMFLYSLVYLTYGILIIFFTGLRDFEDMVLNGGVDRFILRPRGILFQVIASNADWFAAIGQGGLGIVLFTISAHNVGIVWNSTNIIYYLLTVIGGVLIQGSVFLVLASLSFFFIKTANIKELCYWNMRKFAGYPISIFPKIVQILMIYVVPFAFVNYFPAQYLLKNIDMNQFPHVYMYIAPLVGIIMYLCAYCFWRFSIRFYKSTGN